MTDPVLVPRRPWEGRRVVLGVTGGIAAYKSVQLARDLSRLGAGVDVVLTRGATRFIEALTFEAVTGRRALSELFSAEGAALHIRLGTEADVVCVAPATADFIARAAHGRADDLLTTTLLATTAPVVICPAMNHRMYAHRQTGRNIAHVRDVLGYGIARPGVGPLAFGEGEGPGRMLEPSEIVQHVGRALTEDPFLAGKRVLITAGPTREPIDPVRFVGNRSSGKMGYALARAAWRRGADVLLVSGPTALDQPTGVERVEVQTALELRDAVREAIPQADVVIFAAAVADYRPAEAREGKIKRADAGAEIQIELVTNPDVALETVSLRKAGARVVGFALESDDLVPNAHAKLERKAFDLIVANSAVEEEAGFESHTSRVTLIGPRDAVDELPVLPKDEVAEAILDRIGGDTGDIAARGGDAGEAS